MKSVKRKILYYGFLEENEITVSHLTPHCPRCKYILLSDYGKKYCCNCGQKLNWTLGRERNG